MLDTVTVITRTQLADSAWFDASPLVPQAKRQVPEEYPTYAQVPDEVAFTCDDKLPGYYADVDFQCQVRAVAAANSL